MISPIRHVYCENIEQWIWDQLLLWENEQIAYTRLKEKYTNLKAEHPDRAAFKNVPTMIYHLKQARAIFQKEQPTNLWLDPLIFYYGMMSLLKAVMITIDLDYPSHTAVLRHGLSTRKKKRMPYQFLYDEIKIQKEGLFSHAAKQFGQGIPAGSTYRPKELLSMIPELQTTFIEITQEQSLYPLTIHSSEAESVEKGMLFSLEKKVLELIHLSSDRLVERLNRLGEATFSVDSSVETGDQLYLRWKHPQVKHITTWVNGFAHPYFLANQKGDYFLWVGNNHLIQPLPLLWIYYLLMFSLSMLCRYDAPLWGELLGTTKEAVLIERLLCETKRHFPHLILNLLQEEKIILWLR